MGVQAAVGVNGETGLVMEGLDESLSMLSHYWHGRYEDWAGERQRFNILA
jgi:hypothetical protein